MPASYESAPSSAPVPRACRGHATSKAKCIFVPGGKIGEKCRRQSTSSTHTLQNTRTDQWAPCNRLSKECVIQPPVARKRQPRTATWVRLVEQYAAFTITSDLFQPSGPFGGNAGRLVSLLKHPALSTEQVPRQARQHDGLPFSISTICTTPTRHTLLCSTTA
jgi:hypothetical protein